MKQLQKSDLIDGEIYYQNYFNYIFKYNKTTSDKDRGNDGIGMDNKSYYKNWSANKFYSTMREATPQEKHWLETSIKEGFFIRYEEAMKSFIPEYVEVLDTECEINCNISSGRIYKCCKDNSSHYHFSFLLDGKYKIGFHENQLNQFLKPSTKEAYDAQFVVKEPEFVLPEKWCVKGNEQEVIDYSNKYGGYPNYRISNILYHHYPPYMNKCTTLHKIEVGYTEITFEQFKKYVMNQKNKDDILITKEGKYIGAKCSEGGIYKIGDKITPFNKKSANYGKPFIIRGFKWNKSKTEICAITDIHSPNGIRLSQLELYTELKKELSLLEQAKLRYPIGSTIYSALDPKEKYKAIVHGIIKKDDNIYCLNLDNDAECHLYNGGIWAEIVEDFVLPEKWCVEVTVENNTFINSVRDRSCRPNTFITSSLINNEIKNSWWSIPSARYYNFREITLEQFKKYVLNEKV